MPRQPRTPVTPVDPAILADVEHLAAMTDAELHAELDARYVAIERRLTDEAAPELPTLDALGQAYSLDGPLVRAQEARQRRIDAGSWTRT
jgi:MoxR-like ATPase